MTKAYSARKAWSRAAVYFAVCLGASAYFGILPRLYAEAIVGTQQLAMSSWWAMTIIVTVFVVFAYAWFWPQGTVTHGRPRRVFAGTVFGMLWGFCQGQLTLVVYQLIASVGSAAAVNVALTFLVWSAWIALWHSRYWDIRVAPEHNIESWNLRKVLVAHAPFLLLSVTHYALFSNDALFVSWHVIALTASTLAMRFPSPLDD